MCHPCALPPPPLTRGLEHTAALNVTRGGGGTQNRPNTEYGPTYRKGRAKVIYLNRKIEASCKYRTALNATHGGDGGGGSGGSGGGGGGGSSSNLRQHTEREAVGMCKRAGVRVGRVRGFKGENVPSNVEVSRRPVKTGPPEGGG